MSLELSFHPAAEREVLTAAWYAERSAVAAQAFLHELDLVVARMLEAPERWPKSLHGARHIVFPRFPFNLVYRVLPGVAEVVAVADQPAARVLVTLGPSEGRGDRVITALGKPYSTMDGPCIVV
jgi:hypothetical protein